MNRSQFSRLRVLLISGLLAVSTLFVGCGSVSNIKSVPTAESKSMSGYKTIVVLDFENKTMIKGKDSAKQEQYRQMAVAAGKNFADRIASELAGLGIYDQVLREKVDGDCLVISGDVTRYQEGSAAARLWIGMGAGSSYFDANVRFIDGTTGDVIGSLTVDKNSWVLGGGFAAGQTVEHFMARGAKTIAKQLADGRDSSGGPASMGGK